MTSSSLDTTARTRPDRHALTVVFTVIVGTVMVPLDVTVVAVALTRLSEETGASLPVIQWVSTGYTLAVAADDPDRGVGDGTVRRAAGVSHWPSPCSPSGRCWLPCPGTRRA